MNRDNIQDILNKAKQQKVLVLGDIILDKYYITTIDRISPEAPVPIAKIKGEKMALGGAANVAANIVSFGTQVELFGAIGKDPNSEYILKMLEKNNIDFLLKPEDRIAFTTIVKTRVLAKNQQVLRLDREEQTTLSQEIKDFVIQHIKNAHKSLSGIILSDYNKGVFANNFGQDIINLANEHNIPVFVDAKTAVSFQNAFLFKPNLKEAEQFTGITIQEDLSNIEIVARKLQEQVRAEYVVITLSEKGMILYDKKIDTCLRIQSQPKEVYDVSGAGDTVLASLSIAFMTKQRKEIALSFANFNAEIIVGILGTAVITPQKILSQLKHYAKYKSK